MQFHRGRDGIMGIHNRDALKEIVVFYSNYFRFYLVATLTNYVVHFISEYKNSLRRGYLTSGI
ncbi:hypothetical protein [Aeromonas phage SW69-9]|uniref:Uncharacterized protein n=1 Tax=Aeromonas phage 44RR2.8t.2 TaxID=1932900 RepID=A0A219Y9D5_9CAUD|nr:hypothetical protein [Aeromonas phage 44RR2.8t.2]APU01915.1 hypothetical protein [Aeromonas phage L9-6]APU02166.1 hypothetical protein [Aeromonas phage Riv-10]APU02413.1 hypothetical protein [Aeromonas phage SW69-9]